MVTSIACVLHIQAQVQEEMRDAETEAENGSFDTVLDLPDAF